MAYNENNLTKLAALKALAQRAEETYAKKADVSTLSKKVDNLVTAGGEPNVIESIKVNGNAVTVTDKEASFTISSGKTNGTIDVNGSSVFVNGLKPIAYRSSVSKALLDEALSSEITNATTNVATLQGEDTGKSVRSISAEEVAKIVAGADASFDTLKEVADWITSHKTDAATMNTQISDNAVEIWAIKESIKSAQQELQNNYYTKTEVDAKLPSYATDAEVTEMLNEIYGEPTQA